ncbi:hypothetical protein QR680_004011 [Steinernema hermaphroditum]|uniref:Uncharacterized protein n=1 Tax=Steinernema hermaphroditum TaxID=289476 RepID=A0AA39HMD0_9BILA|nr:hypothetical protein QR680_004011 [Steinernema hermaphroditum]
MAHSLYLGYGNRQLLGLIKCPVPDLLANPRELLVHLDAMEDPLAPELLTLLDLKDPREPLVLLNSSGSTETAAAATIALLLFAVHCEFKSLNHIMDITSHLWTSPENHFVFLLRIVESLSSWPCLNQQFP